MIDDPLSSGWQANKLSGVPYECWTIDGLFVESALDAALQAWPDVADPHWRTTRKMIGDSENLLERGIIVINRPGNMPAPAADFFRYLHTRSFADRIGSIVGRSDLLPDTSMQWSGIIQMRPGSHQLIHSDALRHPHEAVRKEFTILIYLNRDWAPALKGELEIWNDDMSRRAATIAPIFNRTFIFKCTENSFHGVPEVAFERKVVTLSLVSPTDLATAKDLRSRALFLPRPGDGEAVARQGRERMSVA